MRIPEVLRKFKVWAELKLGRNSKAEKAEYIVCGACDADSKRADRSAAARKEREEKEGKKSSDDDSSDGGGCSAGAPMRKVYSAEKPEDYAEEAEVKE